MNLTPTQVQITRLTVLADFIADATKVNPKKFSMLRWGTGLIVMLWSRSGKYDTSGKYSCGTTACAAGWACMVPSFRAEGLTMQMDGPTMQMDGPTYRGVSGHAALREFFGLTVEQEHFLFDSFEHNYKPRILTPKQWSKRCRTFLKSL